MWIVECGVSSHVTTCHACHAICTLSPLDATVAMRQCDSQKTRNSYSTPSKCCARVMQNDDGRVQCCACHETCNSSSDNDAEVLRPGIGKEKKRKMKGIRKGEGKGRERKKERKGRRKGKNCRFSHGRFLMPKTIVFVIFFVIVRESCVR